MVVVGGAVRFYSFDRRRPRGEQARGQEEGPGDQRLGDPPAELAAPELAEARHDGRGRLAAEEVAYGQYGEILREHQQSDPAPHDEAGLGRLRPGRGTSTLAGCAVAGVAAPSRTTHHNRAETIRRKRRCRNRNQLRRWVVVLKDIFAAARC